MNSTSPPRSLRKLPQGGLFGAGADDAQTHPRLRRGLDQRRDALFGHQPPQIDEGITRLLARLECIDIDGIRDVREAAGIDAPLREFVEEESGLERQSG